MLSDVHSPIILSLDILKNSSQNSPNELEKREEISLPTDIPYKSIKTNWQPKRKDEYLNNFDLELVNNLYFNLHNIIIGNYIEVSQEILEEHVSSLENILLQPSFLCSFSKNTGHNRKSNSLKSKNDKPWFDENCRIKRNEYFRVNNFEKIYVK